VGVARKEEAALYREESSGWRGGKGKKTLSFGGKKTETPLPDKERGETLRALHPDGKGPPLPL